jgi:REP element-mobilizing transposase RayT
MLYIDGVKAGEYPTFDKAIWQKSFYDHIIRDENEYLRIWEYIDENLLKWETDEYYVKSCREGS